MKQINVSTVIFKSFEGETKKNLQKMIDIIALASRERSEIICFPELCITGYSTSVKILKSALTIQDSIFDRLKETAVSKNITILAGFAEKKESCFFLSHAAFFPSGIMEVYRKLHLSPSEKPLFTMGQDIPVYKSENLSFGIQMCYDAHFPRLSEAMAIKGIDLIFFPHASPRCSSREKLKSWMRHLPARAFDNSIYVLACNQTGRNKSGLTFPGVALCIDPSGNLVDKKFSASDSLLTSRIDLEKIEEVRGHRMKYFLPNTRADIYDS